MKIRFRSIVALCVLFMGFPALAAFPVGDLDHDFIVDLDDVVLFAQQWLQKPDCFGAPGCGDIEGNDGVNIEDFALVAQHWQQRGEITLVINELMASNDSTLEDPDELGEYPDWIEIYNYGNEAIPLSGMVLEDSANTYLIPSGVTIAAGQYLVFYADEDPGQGPLHTSFKLGAGGDEVTLLSYDGQTVIDSVSFSNQAADISYGRYPDAAGDWYTMDSPSPGLTNNVGMAGDVYFSRLSGTFTSNFSLTLSTLSSTAEIRYTTDGSIPTQSSNFYSGPITVNNAQARQIRARAYEFGLAPGPVTSHYYTPLASDVQNFSSNLPIVILDTYGSAISEAPYVHWPSSRLFNPISSTFIDVDKDTGISSMTDTPDYAGRTGMKTRGESSNDWPKKQFSLELWDENDVDTKASLLGMPPESDWVLNAPYGDKSLIRNVLAYKWTNDIEDEYAAPRTKFVEVFLNDDGGKCSYADYNGVYVLVEKIKVSDDRVNIAELEPSDTASPEITGGYILRVDKNYQGEFEEFRTSADMVSNPIQYFDPGQGVLTFDQKQYIQSFLDQFETDLNEAEFCDPNAGYAQHIDIESFIEFDIIAEIFKNVDGFKLSTYFHKERNGKLNFGPHWDYNFSAGNGTNPYWGFPDWFSKASTSEGWFNQTMPVYGWHGRLMDDPDYRLRTADKWYEHREDKLSDTQMAADIDINYGLLTTNVPFAGGADNPADRNFDRWDILNTWVACNYYVGGTYLNEVNWLRAWFCGNGTAPKGDYFDRMQWIDDLWRDDRNIDAPPTLLIDGAPMNTGGTITAGAALTMTGSTGTIYYTTDGTDPRRWTYRDSGANSFTRTLVAESVAKKVLVPVAEVVSSTATGAILREYWTGIGGAAVSDLTSAPDYPDSPAGLDLLTAFEVPTDWADDYGTRIRGYLHPPATKNYTFWISGDDETQLWQSTDANPANMSMIAYVPDWTLPREWYKHGSQQSVSISLTAGQRYYIEVLHKEGGGGDNIAVAWNASGSLEVIDGIYLSPAKLGWTGEGFDDSSWNDYSFSSGRSGGVGYAGSGDWYEPYISYDVDSFMHGEGLNNTCFIRTPFTVDSGDIPSIDTLKLKIRFDDAFIAYINGTEVARSSFAPVTLAWNSNATGYTDPETDALIEFDISAYISKLNAGSANILAVHGMNSGNTSSDFLISFELEASSAGGGDLMPGGEVSPTANIYTGDMTLNDSTRIKARVKNGSDWGAINEAYFSDNRVANYLRVTEIMYHSADPNHEFIEVRNIGSDTINLAWVEFTDGIDFTFPDMPLASGQSAVVVRNQALFETLYGTGITIAGQFTGALNNGGEEIVLRDAFGTEILDFDYDDNWYPITDGAGFSLNIINASDPNLDRWDDKDAWQASSVVNGTPGSVNPANVASNNAIVINEALTHSNSYPNDWIELRNTTGSTVDIGGWFLSDDRGNLRKYQIAAGESIPPYGYKVFTQDDNFGNLASDPGRLVGFGLSELGEEVYLCSGSGGNLTGGYSVWEEFGASEWDVSFGQHVKSDDSIDFVSMQSMTSGAANSGPLVGDIVMTEIMYNPSAVQDQLGEYIELKNTGQVAVNLYDPANPANTWKFTKGIDYTFPTGVSIDPGDRILVVRTDPDIFRVVYSSVPAGVAVYGPFSNSELSNDGEKIELSRPGDPEPGGFVPYIRVEQINYSDGTHPIGEDPWPASADGNGNSLKRVLEDSYSNDLSNWTAASSTPGT